MDLVSSILSSTLLRVRQGGMNSIYWTSSKRPRFGAKSYYQVLALPIGPQLEYLDGEESFKSGIFCVGGSIGEDSGIEEPE